jgi:hypothetical protein
MNCNLSRQCFLSLQERRNRKLRVSRLDFNINMTPGLESEYKFVVCHIKQNVVTSQYQHVCCRLNKSEEVVN